MRDPCNAVQIRENYEKCSHLYSGFRGLASSRFRTRFCHVKTLAVFFVKIRMESGSGLEAQLMGCQFRTSSTIRGSAMSLVLEVL